METAARLAVFYTGSMLAIAAAIAAFFLLVTPLHTRWLTEEERQPAHSRVARDTTDKRYEPSSTWAGLWNAAKDYRTWVFALVANLRLSANGFKNSLPTTVESLGFNTTITLVLTCPPNLLASITSVLVSWSSGRFNERTWHIAISKAITIAGFAAATATYNIGARYFAMILFVGATRSRVWLEKDGIVRRRRRSRFVRLLSFKAKASSTRSGREQAPYTELSSPPTRLAERDGIGSRNGGGGLISAAILFTPGASKVYRGGLTADIDNYEDPTPDIVAGLARNVRVELESIYTVCESGIAGPTGGATRNRTPGYVALAVDGGARGTVTSERRTGHGRRDENMIQFAMTTLGLLGTPF
ncbi:hypothetical protein DL771_001609 [Monosporascus sp. 5C6A]|nr:hypothetical protein DL771_001609 [Monosporascus sp. 5C6A]